MTNDALNLAIAQSIEPKPGRESESPFGDRVTAAWRQDYDRDDWQPRDFINDPSLSFLLLKKMKEEGIQFVIDSEPDYGSVEKIHAHSELINSNQDYEIRVTWGDSNCSHPKPYDPVDGHGYTSFEVIGKLGDIIAEAWARAKGIYVDDK